MPKKLTVLILACLLPLSGCNLIYKQNIQQGNAIEQEKLDQLQMGMTMSQVAFLLGTPAIRDPFHQDRWDYVYTFARRGKNPISRQVTLGFENAVLVSMQGVNVDAEGNEIPADDTQPQDVASSEEAPADDASQVAITPLASTESEAVGPGGGDAAATDAVVPAAGAAGEAAAEPVVTAGPTDPAPAPEPAQAESGPSATVQQHADVFEATDFDQWIIQLGAFESLQNARTLVNRMRSAGFSATIYSQVVGGLGERFLVRSEPFEAKAEAERQLQQINQALELDGFLVPPTP